MHYIPACDEKCLAVNFYLRKSSFWIKVTLITYEEESNAVNEGTRCFNQSVGRRFSPQKVSLKPFYFRKNDSWSFSYASKIWITIAKNHRKKNKGGEDLYHNFYKKKAGFRQSLLAWMLAKTASLLFWYCLEKYITKFDRTNIIRNDFGSSFLWVSLRRYHCTVIKKLHSVYKADCF